ncbi:hypothetical protein KIK06_28675 [Nocardiopsis sp. EMB25]|uniref:hypothetical protein n=1 Tax=Nocardiopsis sp. EMB25 TaxID=2835867 RepID=UPI0022842448|nr:hypothetical protein [Nocardiopsis sp. EMB25]MCY9787858.1 hypothetical protein [Nocardiopsis sp. EMB25]
MGLGRWLRGRSGGSAEFDGRTPEEWRAEEEQRLLAAMRRECDGVRARFRELVLGMPTDRRSGIPAEPPRFASIGEGRAYTDWTSAPFQG